MTILIGSRQPESLGAIKVDSPEWFAWLEEQKSFRFECSYTWHTQAGIVDTKEATCTVIRQGKYWNAQRRVNQQLRRYYLGASDKLTYDGLCEAAKTLTIDPKWGEYLQAKQSPGAQSHKKDIYETKPQATSQTQNENEKLKAQIAKLERELKTISEIAEKNFRERNEMWDEFKKAHAKNQQIQAELDARCQQVSPQSLESSQIRSSEENPNTGKALSSMADEELWALMSRLSKECSSRFPRTTAQLAEELVDQIMTEMEAAELDYNAQLQVVTRITEAFLD